MATTSEKRINDILAELTFLDEPPLPDSELKGDLGIDSLKAVELIIELEDSFGISIEESDLDPQNIMKVSDIYKLVNKYVERDKL